MWTLIQCLFHHAQSLWLAKSLPCLLDGMLTLVEKGLITAIVLSSYFCERRNMSFSHIPAWQVRFLLNSMCQAGSCYSRFKQVTCGRRETTPHATELRPGTRCSLSHYDAVENVQQLSNWRQALFDLQLVTACGCCLITEVVVRT